MPGLALASGLARRADQVCPACGETRMLEPHVGALSDGAFTTWEAGRAQGARRFRRSARVAAGVVGALLVAMMAPLLRS